MSTQLDLHRLNTYEFLDLNLGVVVTVQQYKTFVLKHNIHTQLSIIFQMKNVKNDTDNEKHQQRQTDSVTTDSSLTHILQQDRQNSCRNVKVWFWTIKTCYTQGGAEKELGNYFSIRIL